MGAASLCSCGKRAEACIAALVKRLLLRLYFQYLIDSDGNTVINYYNITNLTLVGEKDFERIFNFAFTF